ncbi:MAG: filamentous hemagglutinin N-terminal domain-containing protein, partial [Gammaproteobacteria bacterium]
MVKLHLTPIAACLRTSVAVLGSSSLLLPPPALANPTGAEVVHGQVGISAPAPGGLVVDQQSNAAIINWQTFSIGSDEYVLFNQPSASAAVLNRVIGNLPSEILGSLSANGQVFLINAQGVMFGAGARVDVGALVASTHDIRDEDFLSGRYVFAGDSSAGIDNAGQIRAADGGFVVLTADHLRNSGTIESADGSVVLAAGNQLSLHLDAEGLVDYAIDAAAVSELAGIDNAGEILARGGAVIMHAEVARGLIGNVVNNSGRVAANAIEARGGEIYLVANGGNLAQTGTLDASSSSGDGGRIEILSDQDILIGAGSDTDASGARGGAVVAIAGDTLDYAAGGRISVAGGDGVAELSGHHVRIGEVVDLDGGQLLIDPYDFIADNDRTDPDVSIDYATLDSQLSFGDVLIEAENSVIFRDLDVEGSSEFTPDPFYGGSLTLRTGVACTPDPCTPTGRPAGIYFEGADDIFNIAGDFILDNSATEGPVQSLAQLNSGGLLQVWSGGAIDVAGLSARQIELIARDGISAGALVARDVAEFNEDGLFASIHVRANNLEAADTAAAVPVDISIASIDVSTDAGTFSGVSAGAWVDIQSVQSADGRRDGGSVTLGGPLS